MSVYVDDMEAPFGRMVMCHMIADTHRELIEMADQIGVDRRWIQQRGAAGEHFDISKAKRALAVRAGAIEVSIRTLAQMCRDRRSESGRLAYMEYPTPEAAQQTDAEPTCEEPQP